MHSMPRAELWTISGTYILCSSRSLQLMVYGFALKAQDLIGAHILLPARYVEEALQS